MTIVAKIIYKNTPRLSIVPIASIMMAALIGSNQMRTYGLGTSGKIIGIADKIGIFPKIGP